MRDFIQVVAQEQSGDFNGQSLELSKRFTIGETHEPTGDFNTQYLEPEESLYNMRSSWTKHNILTVNPTN